MIEPAAMKALSFSFMSSQHLFEFFKLLYCRLIIF